MEEREKVSLKAVRIAMSTNIFLAAVKVVLGIIGDSIALIGDGLDTTVDVVKNIIVYKGTQIAAQPPDMEHPYGHGGAETISSSIIGVSVVFAGILLITQAIGRFGQTQAMDTLMIIGASISIIGKVFLSTYMNSVGKKVNNFALIANAKDYFGDVLASVAVLVGGIVIRFTGKTYFDSIASLFVAFFIMYMGIDILKPAVSEMMEENAPEIVSQVKEIITEFKDVYNPHHIRVRKLGSDYFIDIHIEFMPDMPIIRVHDIATSIEEEIKKRIQNVKEVIIHPEPYTKTS
ncbi:MAG: cation transporter [Candidatus Atribacteria bacterium]|nr:cation transporter [Candidatus Atribacteria bacterium]